MIRTSLAAALALCLAACASIVPSPATQVVVADDQLGIETGYSAFATAYLAAAPSLPAATKAAAKGWLLKIMTCTGAAPDYACTGYLPAARAASAAAQSATLTTEIGLIQAAVCQGTAALHGTSAAACPATPAT